MKAERKTGRWGIDTSMPCPTCGAKCVGAGELAFTRKDGRKWIGPYAEFECGMFLVLPGAGTKAECVPEMWNMCTGTSQNGKPVVDIGKDDYEIREGKPDPVPAWIAHRGYKFTFSIDGTASSTATNY